MSPISVVSAGTERKVNDHGIRDRVIPHYNLIVVDQGNGFIETGAAGRVPVHANSAIMLLPGVLHSYAADPSWQERWFLLDGPGLDSLRETGWLTPAQPVANLGRNQNTLHAFERAWEGFRHGGPFAEERISAALHEFFVLCRSHCWSRGKETPAEQARDILERESTHRVRPEDIAEQLQVPYSTLRRQFRRLTGRSLQEYAIIVRLNRARHLLMSTEKTISEVSDACGFEEPYYFTRMFKKRLGMSPTQFRATNYF